MEKTMPLGSHVEMCMGQKFSARPGLQFLGHFAARSQLQPGPARSPAITAHSNRGCSNLCMQCTSTGLYKLSAGVDWKVVMHFRKILACFDKQLYGPCLYCVYLNYCICLLLRKFSKVRAARRRPGAQQATARPAGHVGPGLAAHGPPGPRSSLVTGHNNSENLPYYYVTDSNIKLTPMASCTSCLKSSFLRLSESGFFLAPSLTSSFSSND